LPRTLRSWRYIVGGFGDAERSISPVLEIARTFGGEGCAWSGGSSSAVGMEYAWIERLRVVVK
jgi:hypothetical protein